MLSLARALRHTDASAIPEWTYPTVNSPEVPGALGPVPSEDQAMVQQFLSYGLPARAATATATPTTAPSLKPSSIAVRVLNGSGTPGQAAQAASALRAQGFSVSSTGDASAFDYTSNVVQYGPQGLTAAKVLQASVGGTTQLVEVPSLTGNNLVLVTGSSYAAGTPASPPGTASPPTSASPTTSVSPTTSAPTTVETDSSSFFHGEYVPPGLQPGQVPEKCPS
jgi:hypothetical protein